MCDFPLLRLIAREHPCPLQEQIAYKIPQNSMDYNDMGSET